ncbi:MAG: ATP-binding cassette domain-containing protein [Bacteroidetes bacterium]|nr:ATP-binding cassette domain-containing protein [Bacteroidota bacterium]
MIQIKELKKSINDRVILDGINLDVKDGQTLCIIGKSGCGKSVLLKNIVGLMQPDSGSILVDGLNVPALNKNELFNLRKTIGYVFQGAALFDSLNIYENVILRLYEHNERNKEVLESEAKRVLSSVGLLPDISEINTTYFENEWINLSNKMPSELSGGMKKRVGVARALVGTPKYILYDEPTTGLDPITSEQIDKLIFNLANNLQITSIVITHDMFSVYKLNCDIAMLNNGRIHFFGSSSDFNASSDPVIREFLERYS